MPLHPLGRSSSNAMDFIDGQGFNKAGSVLRRNNGLAITLVQLTRYIGKKLVVADASRRIEAGDNLDLRADFQRQFHGALHALKILGHIEIGFVER